MNSLTLQYTYDTSFNNPNTVTDDFGWLNIRASTERFSGEGGFWVQWQCLREFADELSQYPIKKEEPINAEWGFGSQDGGQTIILRIEISPLDARGNLILRFEIADYEPENEPRDRVRGAFTTGYPEVETFRKEIGLMMDQLAEKAALKGR